MSRFWIPRHRMVVMVYRVDLGGQHHYRHCNRLVGMVKLCWVVRSRVVRHGRVVVHHVVVVHYGRQVVTSVVTMHLVVLLVDGVVGAMVRHAVAHVVGGGGDGDVVVRAAAGEGGGAGAGQGRGRAQGREQRQGGVGRYIVGRRQHVGGLQPGRVRRGIALVNIVLVLLLVSTDFLLDNVFKINLGLFLLLRFVTLRWFRGFI